MNTKSIALIVAFAAVAIASNAIRIPSVFYPGTYYGISQIPIVIAFLLFGTKIGVLVGVFTAAGELALFPVGPSSIIVYPMEFVSVLIMFVGLFVASRSVIHNGESERVPFWKKPLVGLTAFAVVFRGGIMPFIDYGVIYHVLAPLVLGINIPEAIIIGLVPAFVLYNVIVPLYVVPIAYVVATRVSMYLKIELHFLRKVPDLRERDRCPGNGFLKLKK
jgi:hypothetical protein